MATALKCFRALSKSTFLVSSSSSPSAAFVIGLPKKTLDGIGLRKSIVTSTSPVTAKSNRKTRELIATKTRVVSYLEKNLKLTAVEASLTLIVHPTLKNLKFEDTSSLIDFLIKRNFTLQQLKENPWILLYPLDTIETNFKLIESKLGEVRVENFFLLAQHTKVLMNIMSSLDEDKLHGIDRIDYLAKELECEKMELNQLLHRQSPLLVMKFDRLKDIMELLKSYQVSPEIIRRDLWIFRHNRTRMDERLRRLNEVSLSPIRTWMLRCDEEVFTRCVDKWRRHQAVFQSHCDIIGYLAERLKKSEDFVRDEFVKKNPFILRVNPPKVKEVLDFLFEKGYTPDQVMASPRVFEMSVMSLRQRLEKLSEFDHVPSNLRVLGIQWKSFDEYVNKIKRAKGLKEKIKNQQSS